MDIFASDLDNTLIYSYQHDIGTEKVLAERYEGREISYMTAYTHQVLDWIFRHLLFIPVTTRSLEQYQRLWFSEQWQPKLALTSNGGILLVDGKLDEDWYTTSKRLVEPAEQAMQQAETILAADPYRTLEVRRVDGLFVYTKSSNISQTINRLESELDLTMVEIRSGAMKVYILPRSLHKGQAIQRLRPRFTEPLRIFSAGDSQFDLSLLEAADIAFCPQQLKYVARAGQQLIVIRQGLFSDVLLKSIQQIVKDGFSSSSHTFL